MSKDQRGIAFHRVLNKEDLRLGLWFQGIMFFRAFALLLWLFSVFADTERTSENMGAVKPAHPDYSHLSV